MYRDNSVSKPLQNERISFTFENYSKFKGKIHKQIKEVPAGSKIYIFSVEWTLKLLEVQIMGNLRH